ncbi:hypothetical protein [Terrabacter carboxydivorans]|uniref:hypothetical protein n=1 Tax=Terrabacter carboxydivorans TaxID=619730 RepID=UPI0031D75DE9
MTTISPSRRSSWRRFRACAFDDVRQRWGSGNVDEIRAHTDKLMAQIAQIEADVERARASCEAGANRLEGLARGIELSVQSAPPATEHRPSS